MGVLSVLVTCCEIVSRIQWKIVRDICLDIYRLTVEGNQNELDFLNQPVEVSADPIKTFQEVDTKDKLFRFVMFVVWLHENHPELAYYYYKEITLKYPEQCSSKRKLIETLVGLRYVE